MLNQHLLAALLAITTMTSTVIVNVSPSSGNEVIKYCTRNSPKCLPIKPIVKHVIPAIQRRIDQRPNEQKRVSQELQRLRRQQLGTSRK